MTPLTEEETEAQTGKRWAKITASGSRAPGTFAESVHWVIRMGTPKEAEVGGGRGDRSQNTDNQGEEAWHPGHRLSASVPLWPLGAGGLAPWSRLLPASGEGP